MKNYLFMKELLWDRMMPLRIEVQSVPCSI
jgi:hypothetical protein